jgi:hypothetical protein
MADPRAASAIDMVRFFFISSNMTLVLELRDTKERNYFKIFSKSLGHGRSGCRSGCRLQVAGCNLSCNLQPATYNLE